MFEKDNYLRRLILDREIYRSFPNDVYAKKLSSDIATIRWQSYLKAKVARTYLMRVRLTFTTGVAGETRVQLTNGVNARLIVVAATTDAPTNMTVSVKETSRERLLTNEQMPAMSIFANTTNTVEKYFRFPAPIVLDAQSVLEVTGIAGAGGLNASYDFVFQCIWVNDTASFSGNIADQTLDQRVKQYYIEEDRDLRTFALAFDFQTNFAGVASERVLARTQQQSDALLVLGFQQSIIDKSAPTDPVTVNITDLTTNYNFATEEMPIWAVANYLTESEIYLELAHPYLLRPYGQLQANFTNNAAGTATGGQLVAITRTP